MKVFGKVKKNSNKKEIGMMSEEKRHKKNFVEKVEVSYNQKKTRRQILMDIKKEIILRALDDNEDYDSIKEDLQAVYDKNHILTTMDLYALECLCEAIHEGNRQVNMSIENPITIFLKQKPENLERLIEEMIKDANDIYGKVKIHHEGEKNIESLIASSYYEIMEMVEDIQERQEEQEYKY